MLVTICGSCGQKTDYSPRFWAQVDKSAGPDGCWIWQGALHRGGYGKVGWNRRTTTAHRLAYEDVYGVIPKRTRAHDTCVCHRCDNRLCCNPRHLYLGTMKENIRDREERGRSRDQRGERHNMAKLSTGEVFAIRRRASEGEEQKALAAEFGVSRGMLSLIVNRKNWTHI